MATTPSDAVNTDHATTPAEACNSNPSPRGWIVNASGTTKAGAESKAMCDFNLALADVILAKPPGEAGALVRSMWALQ